MRRRPIWTPSVLCRTAIGSSLHADGDRARFDGVRVIGVDEHVWRHTRGGDMYVTVIIDLTAVRDGTGPARLLDMVEGRSKQAFQQLLAGQPESWRAGVDPPDARKQARRSMTELTMR